MSNGQGKGSQSVVVPAIDAPSSVACLRSLGGRGIYTIAASEQRSAAAFRSRFCDEAVTVSDPEADLLAYRDEILSLAKRPAVDAIVPVREADVYVLAKYRDEFAPHVRPLWPSMGALGTVQDRVRLFEAAAEVGVAAPETQRLDECDDWSSKQIVKGRYSILADEYLESYPADRATEPPGTTYLDPGTDPDVSALESSMGHVPIVQEFLPSTDEYGFFALYDEGTPVATFQHRQRRAWHYAGGPSAYRESVDIPALEDAGRSLLDHLEWHGLAMVEFLRDDESDEFKLMEINPRFWSSLPFSVQAGADFPYYYWLLAHESPDQVDDDYDVGVAGHLLRGELAYLYSVLADDTPLVERPPVETAVRDVFSSVVRHPRFDYLDREDPAPFVHDLVQTGLQAVK